MTLRLQWRAGGSADCFYAVRRLTDGRKSVGADVATVFGESAVALDRFLAANSISREPFYERLVPSAAVMESNRDLARAVLVKTVGGERAATLVEPLAALLGDCERPYFHAFPQLLDDLELRSRPLRELWEARGPGLLAGVGKRTDRRLMVDEATVNLAQPYLGGGGFSHAAYNSVTFEAVLADPQAQLPETVRLAWLLSTLSADLPDFVELLPPGKAATVVALAMLPPVLEAAADVEWVRPNDGLLDVAANTWEAPQPAGEQTIAIVGRWWDFARRNAAPWNVSLTALGRLLDEATVPGRDGPAI